ncbi:MAG: hypothetical protein QM519_01340 [Bacteroidia bacterium]|nr:hypothetical protein [Bacteroidia bacterium]
MAYTIATGYAVNIFQNQPVRIAPATSGGQTEGTIVAAATGEAFIGTFQGVEFTDSDGRYRVSNKWTASTAATTITAYVTSDPAIVYEVQTNANVTTADIGKQYDFASTTSGNSTTGLSSASLDVASAAANASVRLVGLSTAVEDTATDAYLTVEVQISEHQFVADKAAI